MQFTHSRFMTMNLKSISGTFCTALMRVTIFGILVSFAPKNGYEKDRKYTNDPSGTSLTIFWNSVVMHSHEYSTNPPPLSAFLAS